MPQGFHLVAFSAAGVLNRGAIPASSPYSPNVGEGVFYELRLQRRSRKLTKIDAPDNGSWHHADGGKGRPP
jgi:hypothetical protein